MYLVLDNLYHFKTEFFDKMFIVFLVFITVESVKEKWNNLSIRSDNRIVVSDTCKKRDCTDYTVQILKPKQNYK